MMTSIDHNRLCEVADALLTPKDKRSFEQHATIITTQGDDFNQVIAFVQRLGYLREMFDASGEAR